MQEVIYIELIAFPKPSQIVTESRKKHDSHNRYGKAVLRI
ncbi:conserved protein of unknown function [Limnospira indica PCC 8005]|uniref:Uncharacterized protein n=1 Tax=Limnospira indica PCC 8005 TaxID=376219 RepID=A0A9P1P030_9CYAN|nr:conserved protein of unknown function [Limnospira indica PCC 8005]